MTGLAVEIGRLGHGDDGDELVGPHAGRGQGPGHHRRVDLQRVLERLRQRGLVGHASGLDPDGDAVDLPGQHLTAVAQDGGALAARSSVRSSTSVAARACG